MRILIKNFKVPPLLPQKARNGGLSLVLLDNSANICLKFKVYFFRYPTVIKILEHSLYIDTLYANV